MASRASGRMHPSAQGGGWFLIRAVERHLQVCRGNHSDDVARHRAVLPNAHPLFQSMSDFCEHGAPESSTNVSSANFCFMRVLHFADCTQGISRRAGRKMLTAHGPSGARPSFLRLGFWVGDDMQSASRRARRILRHVASWGDRGSHLHNRNAG